MPDYNESMRDILREASEGLEAETTPHPETPTEEPAPRKKPARYEKLIRSETRFTRLQIDQMDRLRKEIIRRREGGGERITNNTLVRVALDGLLAHRDQISGATERELKDSWLAFLERATRATTQDLPAPTSEGDQQHHF